MASRAENAAAVLTVVFILVVLGGLFPYILYPDGDIGNTPLFVAGTVTALTALRFVFL